MGNYEWQLSPRWTVRTWCMGWQNSACQGHMEGKSYEVGCGWASLEQKNICQQKWMSLNCCWFWLKLAPCLASEMLTEPKCCIWHWVARINEDFLVTARNEHFLPQAQCYFHHGSSQFLPKVVNRSSMNETKTTWRSKRKDGKASHQACHAVPDLHWYDSVHWQTWWSRLPLWSACGNS